MPTITVQLPQFDGFALAPDDISMGEAETKEIEAVRNCVPVKVKFVRRSVTLRLRGLNQAEVAPYLTQASNTATQMIDNTLTTQDIVLPNGITLRSAFLYRASPSGAIKIGDTWAGITLELEYHSGVFE
jgi:hypothetical protein